MTMENLLVKNPDGLGKYVDVTYNRPLSDEEIHNYWYIDNLPFYFIYRGITYTVVLDSDFVIKLKENPPSSEYVAHRLATDLNFVLDKMFEALNIEKGEVEIKII